MLRRHPHRTSNLPHWRTETKDGAGGFHRPQLGPGRQPGSRRGKQGGSLGVSLLVIQLVLCQEEVAAWRNASTF